MIAMLATIDITFDSADDAKRVQRAITPDNTPVPSGIDIHTKVLERVLSIVIRCERGIDSFRATVEDIMSAIDLSIRTQQSLE